MVEFGKYPLTYRWRISDTYTKRIIFLALRSNSLLMAGVSKESVVMPKNVVRKAMQSKSFKLFSRWGGVNARIRCPRCADILAGSQTKSSGINSAILVVFFVLLILS